MPNIIDSQLRVEGPTESLELFKNSFGVLNSHREVEDIDLNLLFPVPQNLHTDSATEEQKKLKNRLQLLLWGIPTWCVVDNIAHYTPFVIESKDSDLYTFTSAWNAPVNFVQHASIIFNDLEFSLVSQDVSNGSAEFYEISNGAINSSKVENRFK